ATRALFDGGQLRTGDLGYVADGELFVTGRKKDLIILSGRNHDPQSIERVASEVPGVRRGNVVAFSRPGRNTEELVVVAEARGEDGAALVRAIRTRLNDELQLAAADVRVVAPGSLPKTSSGKLQRNRARQLYLDGGFAPEQEAKG